MSDNVFTLTDRIEGSKADQRQIGGGHYASELQHWDLIERYGIGYLEGCATKYVTRHRKKNGKQDLLKAQHYVQKLIELYDEGVRLPRGIVPINVVGDFTKANELDTLEMAVVVHLCSWNCRGHLEMAAKDLEDLLIQYR
jgi:hypothetical protein